MTVTAGRIYVLSDGYPPWERGGAQKIAAQLAEGYARRGNDVTVLTTVADRSDAGESTVDDGGVRVRRVWSPRWRRALPYLTLYNPFAASGIARRLRAADPDAVHVHNAHYLSNRALAAAGACDAPVVKTYHDAGTFAYGEYTAHVADAPQSPALPVPGSAYRADPVRQAREEGLRYLPIRNRHNRRTLERHVDAGVAVSDALRRALTANGMPCHRTVHNGVDASKFGASGDADADARAFRESHGLGDDPFALFGGRTGYAKGGAHLARAFGRATGRTPDARLVVTGDDDFVDRMRELAAPYGDRIVSTGWVPRDDLRAALRAATVVATPSVHLDPFPTVNLEALAAGTPPVTTRFGGASELVGDGETGRVVDPRDVGELADALASLLCDPDRAAEMGRRGRRTVEREYTVEAQVTAYLDLFGALGADVSK